MKSILYILSVFKYQRGEHTRVKQVSLKKSIDDEVHTLGSTIYILINVNFNIRRLEKGDSTSSSIKSFGNFRTCHFMHVIPRMRMPFQNNN